MACKFTLTGKTQKTFWILTKAQLANLVSSAVL
jgi:hypothetical protein